MRIRLVPIHALRPTSIRLAVALVLFAATLAAGAGPAAAQAGKSPAGTRIFVTIDGLKQGKLKGEAGLGERIPVLRVSYAVSAGRDTATGQASGKRQHGEVVIVKDWGAATPQLFQALVQNEPLKSVVIEFYRTGSTGQEEAVEIMRLSDAAVSKIQMSVSDSTSPDGPAGRLVDRIELTFRKIEISHPSAKTVATDDWITH